MKSVESITPKSIGWLEVKLDDKELDYLWKAVDEKGLNHRTRLAGNISESRLLEDKDNWFFDNVLQKLAIKYSDSFKNLADSFPSTQRHPLSMQSMWVNYQKEGEFNPTHHHGGVYSIVVWLKIPTHHSDQRRLPFVRGSNEKNAVSNFTFLYPDMLGVINGYYYDMEPEVEGTLLFFPSQLQHQVYPFYNCKEDRITLSGNLGLDTSIIS